MMSSLIASAALEPPVSTSAIVGSHVGRQVEVLGEVALGVEVDGERAHPAAPQHVGERAHRGRLAGAALLGEDGDLDGHRPDTTRHRPGGAGPSAALADRVQRGCPMLAAGAGTSASIAGIDRNSR